MISKSYIASNLTHFNTRYMKAKTQRESVYCSKLAILELCGWVEQSIDSIYIDYYKKRLKEKNNIETAENNVKKCYGFNYKKNFRALFITLIGIINFERLESQVNTLNKAILESEFGNLTKTRNSLAHTYIKGTQIQIDSPSVTTARFYRIYPALLDYQKVLNKIK